MERENLHGKGKGIEKAEGDPIECEARYHPGFPLSTERIVESGKLGDNVRE